MLFAHHTFIGIDPTAGFVPFVYAALDSELKLLALSNGSMQEVIAFCGGQKSATIAICAPRQPNQGRMRDERVRERLSPPPKPGRYLDFRVSEYLLRQRNISIPQTFAQEKKCPRWMQMGFKCYRQLNSMGYENYSGEIKERLLIEVYPHACFTVLLGILPFQKHTLMGRVQRQLLLIDLGINLSDPMRIFEEITRHRLLKGELNVEALCTPAELDAIIAAYTAWKISAHPQDISIVGDADEGWIILPTNTLKSNYRYASGGI